MKKLIYITAGLVGASILGFSAMGVASAASTHSGSSNVGSSDIPKSVFRQERLQAASQVLNTSISNIKSAHKDKTFPELITNAGLTRKTYLEKLKSRLPIVLEAKGYSREEITIALQHQLIVYLRHHAANS